MMQPILGELLARAAILMTLGWIAAVALRGRSASVRAFIWSATFAGLLVLPALTLLGPRWPVVVRLASAAPDSPATPVSMPASAPAVSAAPQIVEVPGRDVRDDESSGTFAGSVEPALTPIVRILLVSLAVTCVLIVRIALSHRRAARLARTSSQAADISWRALLDDTRARLGIRRDVAIRVTDAVSVPAVAGVIRPALLLPPDADEWSDKVRRAVVVHELAHVARWDALDQLVSSIACAVYWFVPPVWFSARRAAILRERASDDIVLRSGIRPALYAESLVRLVQQSDGVELRPAALAMGQASRIRERLMAILNPDQRRAVLSRSRAAMLAATATIAIVATAAVDLVATVMPVPVAHATLAPHVVETRAHVAAPVAEPAPSATRTPVAAPQTAPAPARREPLCGNNLKQSSNSIHQDDTTRRWTVTLQGTNCSVDLRAEGKIDFNADFTDVAAISPGGFFRLDVTDHGVRRQLEIESRNGTLARTWRVDGKDQPYDTAARAWFAGFLIELDRRTGVGMDVRLPMLLRQGGVDAVLAETALLSGDYVRSRYYAGLARATRLSSGDLTRLLRQAASVMTSDYYAAELIAAVGGQSLEEAGVRAAIAEIVDHMESDYYRSESIGKLMTSGKPTANEVDLILKTAGRISSDYYRSDVIGRLLTASLTDRHLLTVVDLAKGMRSDYYKSETLTRIARHGAANDAVRNAVLAVATGMQGYYGDQVRRAVRR